MKMWNTTNGLGQQVTWYSEEDIKKYKQVLKKNRMLLYWSFLPNKRGKMFEKHNT